LGDTLTYYRLRVGEIPEETLKFAKKFRYSGIFILEPLSFYAKDNLRQEDRKEAEIIHKSIIKTYEELLRQEDRKEAEIIHKSIIKTYEELGYKLIFVPVMSVNKRVKFILSKINKEIF